MRTLVAALTLVWALPASAQGIFSYDASLGGLPQVQGWGATYDQGYTNGSSSSVPIVEDGLLCSDTTGDAFSGSGHQWWFEWSPYFCDFSVHEAFMEVTVQVISSNWAVSGSGLIRSGWDAAFGDWLYNFGLGLTDEGYYVYTTLQAPADESPVIPFDTTDGLHTYRIEVNAGGGALYIDGAWQMDIPFGPSHGFDFGYATFGDSQGLVGGLTSHTKVAGFSYGCIEAEASCPGDITGDGSLDVVDTQCAVVMATWALLGGTDPEPFCAVPDVSAADLNCDADWTVSDVQISILNAIGAPLPMEIDGDQDGCADACQPAQPE